MESGKPLKRTPLKRGDKPLKTTKSLPRTKGRPAVIAERKKDDLEVVNAWRKTYLAQHPFCMIWWDMGCTRVASTLHEPYTRARAGGRLETLMSPANVLPTCTYCHRCVHDNVAEATARGYLTDTEPDDTVDVL